MPARTLLDVLGLDDNGHRVGHQVTSGIDQVRTRDVALVVPRSQVVRTDGVSDDKDSVAEVLSVDRCGDDAD